MKALVPSAVTTLITILFCDSSLLKFHFSAFVLAFLCWRSMLGCLDFFFFLFPGGVTEAFYLSHPTRSPNSHMLLPFSTKKEALGENQLMLCHCHAVSIFKKSCLKYIVFSKDRYLCLDVVKPSSSLPCW